MPELAIMFIKDPRTRFSLALEANDLNAAFDAAKSLDSADSWIRFKNVGDKYFIFVIQGWDNRVC